MTCKTVNDSATLILHVTVVRVVILLR